MIKQGATCGIYRILNNVNGNFYVGSSKNIKARWLSHRSRLRCGAHYALLLQRSWDAHGEKVFSLEVLEVVEDVATLLEREQFWMNELQAFNQPNGCNHNSAVMPKSFEAK